MHFEIDRLIGAVSREITDAEVDGQPVRGAVASRDYPTSIVDLWDALTNPERLPRWFLPVSGDLRLGGRYQLEGNAGGEITECEPPKRLAVTWCMNDQVSWVRVDLAEVSEKVTRLRLEHFAPMPDSTWDQFGPGATGIGWELGLRALEEHLATGQQVDPQAAEAWALSDEGKGYIRLSSDAWGTAAIAAGTDEAAALTRAERVRVFYSGEGQ
ncbi:MAG: SRPBCC family protein [Acidobacteriota bacterium]